MHSNTSKATPFNIFPALDKTPFRLNGKKTRFKRTDNFFKTSLKKGSKMTFVNYCNDTSSKNVFLKLILDIFYGKYSAY